MVRGPWALCGHNSRTQGWKLHVSTTPRQATRLLERIVPIILRWHAPFKVVREASALSRLNEGVLGGTQIGKFVTVYPTADGQAQPLADALCTATAGFQGPAVITDRKLGDVVYARYGGFEPVVERDRLGHLLRFIRGPDGELVPDEYRVPFKAPDWTEDPFPCSGTDSGTRQRRPLLGDRYLLLETIKPSAKGSVFLALDLTRQSDVQLTVIKEGRAHCLEDARGRDMRTRLRRQALLHRHLSRVAPVPGAADYFEVAGNGYLPVTYIFGRTFDSLARQPWNVLDPDARRRTTLLLAHVAKAVQRLHGAGFIHRDLTPTNVLVADDETVWLLDLELAHSVGSDEPALSQGTPGFASPEQVAGADPTVAADVFAFGSLGALILTAIDPRRIHHAQPTNVARQLEELSGAPASLASLLARCISPAAPARPGLEEVIACLQDVEANEAHGRPAPLLRAQSNDGRGFLSVARAAAKGLLSGVQRDRASGLWMSQIPTDGGGEPLASEYTLYRSANRGVAGVVYALARLVRTGQAPASARERIAQAVDWLLAHHPTTDDQMPGLHFGEAGVATAVAEAVASGAIESGPWLEPYLRTALAGPLDWPDLTHGAAGQGLAAFVTADTLGLESIRELTHRCAAYLLELQDEDGGWTLPEGVAGMTGARYTGFAHGAAGIAYFLSEYGRRFEDAAVTERAQAAAEWLVLNARPSGTDGLTWPMRAGEHETWHWWCHGAPGISLAFMHLYETIGDERYARIATAALHSLPDTVRSSNLSQCHGLAGLVEIYLEAARVLGDPTWRTRAELLGGILVNLARDDPSAGTTWLVEDPFRPTGDLMVGCGGVAHALLRLACARDVGGPPLLLSRAR